VEIGTGRLAMNPNPSGSRDVVELWGREFNVVKNGLSEAQVVSFVNDLVKQHDVLLQRQEHLAALTTLAERTVTEADKLAEQMKGESKKQSQEQAAKIIAEAEASAKSESSRILAQAQGLAEKAAKEKETQALAAADKLAAELKRAAETEAKRVIAEAESKGRHIIEQKEAEAVATASTEAEAILAHARQEASTILEKEKRRVQPEISQFVLRLRSQLLTELDQLRSQVGGLQPQFDGSERERPTEIRSPVRQNVEKRDEFLDLMDGSEATESGEPEWEIEIVPPIDIMKIMSIVGHVDGLTGVARTEIIPRNDRTSIIVYTSGPLAILDSIKALAEVAQAEETGNPKDQNAKPRKITVALSSVKSVPETVPASEDKPTGSDI
jgi:vacuolar-type H+-ATPase subunit E/Vma4